METLEKTLAKVNANYKVLATREGVLIKVPKSGDAELKWMRAHHIVSLDGPHFVEEHYRRGQPTKRRKKTKKNKLILITKRFFLGPEHFGKTILATVKVVKKIDHHQGEEFILLDIHPAESGGASYELKFETELTEEEFENSNKETTFKVPGTTFVYRENGIKKKVDECIVFVER